MRRYELQLMQDLPAWFPLSGRAPFGEREFVPVGSTLRLSALPERLFTGSIGQVPETAPVKVALDEPGVGQRPLASLLEIQRSFDKTDGLPGKEQDRLYPV